MKCRRRESLLSILVIAFITSAWGKSAAIKRENSYTINRVSPNTVQSINSFPNEDCAKVRHHKIVKKQMGISIYNQDDKKNSTKGKIYFLMGTNIYRKAKFQDKKTDEALIACESIKPNPCYLTLEKPHKKLSYKKSNDFLNWRRKRSLNAETKTKRENQALPVQKQNEIHERGCALCSKIPIKRTIELKKNKCKRSNFQEFPVNEKSNEIFENRIKSSVSKIPSTVKKRNFNFNKILYPCPEDPEPSNEWLDASQGTGSKIPSEFKPKPKMKLKIYYLRCKKSNEKRSGKKISTKRCALYKSFGYDNIENAIRMSRDKESVYDHNAHRHRPRSYVIRRNEKQKEKDENSEEEEYDEDDEEDEYEGLEDEADQSDRKNNRRGEEKLYSKEGLKDLFKSAKEALVNRVKMNEPSVPQFVGKINYSTKETESPCDDDKSNKVLIDANIKVDEEISSALRNILAKGKIRKTI